MTTQPDKVPAWATNDLFVSGGDPWDGDPTKVEPAAGRTLEGFEPTQKPPADHFNWLLNRIGRWIGHWSEFLLWNWFAGGAFGGGEIRKFAHDTGADSGRGIFIAVQDDGGRRFASDGINFAAASVAGVSTDLRGAAGDQSSLFVVVGADAAGRSIESSPDGDVYTDRVPGSGGGGGDLFFAVVWDPSNSLFVAVGNGEVVDTSPDGITWTARVTPATDDLLGVATDGSTIIVAVGDAGKILTSPDGVTWTARVSGIANDLEDVVWAGDLGLFVAMGTADMLTSPDGITWSAATHPDPLLSSEGGIATDGRVLYTTGSIISNLRSFSVDGAVTWKSINTGNAGINKQSWIDFVRGRYFLGGGNVNTFQFTLRFEE